MTATLWVTLLLGVGGSLGALFTVYSQIRDWRTNRTKTQGEIKLDSKEYERIAADAARINSAERIETEKWWKEQFEAVREQLEDEQKWRRKVNRRMKAHEQWDRDVADRLRHHGEIVPDPPSWDPEDEEPIE